MAPRYPAAVKATSHPPLMIVDDLFDVGHVESPSSNPPTTDGSHSEPANIIHSTPVSLRMSSNRSFFGDSPSVVENYLKAELRGSKTGKATFEQLLAFTGCEKVVSEKLAEKIEQDSEQIKSYRAWAACQGEEKKQYNPFCDWMNRIVALIPMTLGSGQRTIAFMNTSTQLIPGASGYVGGKESHRKGAGGKPDVCCVWRQDRGSKSLRWHQILIPFEFKKGDEFPVFNDQNPTAVGSQKPKADSLGVEMKATSKSKSHSSQDHGAEPKKSQKPKDNFCRRGYLFQSERGPDDFVRYNFTNHDLQLARYAMETLAAVGDRTHCFAFQVKRPAIIPWYFDRCGAVITDPLDVSTPQGKRSLIKLIAAIIHMSSTAMGFNQVLPKQCELRRDLVGIAIADPQKPDKPVVLDTLLDRRVGLVSRGTVAYKGNCDGQVAAFKISWQHVRRTREYTTLERLQKGDFEKHIVRLISGWDGPSISTLRSELGRDSEPDLYEDRICTFLITEYLHPLELLEDPSHLLHVAWALLDAVEFLHSLGWVHRDISYGNVGLEYLNDCQGIRVKLLDFDLSKHKEDGKGGPHWTGTLPFMSTELLNRHEHPDGMARPHLVGFDVESILWLILWMARVLKKSEVEEAASPAGFKSWCDAKNAKPKDVRRKKVGYLFDANLTNAFYEPLFGKLESLCRFWRDKLWGPLPARFEDREARLQESYGPGIIAKVRQKLEDDSWNKPARHCGCGDHWPRSFKGSSSPS